VKTDLDPFNIKILDLKNPRIGLLKPVTSLDIFDGATTNLNDEGLFSISIFGRVGDPARDKQFGYIYLKTTIFHPVIHKTLSRIKALYSGIMSGTAYAIWDDVKKDFIPATQLDGQTGYHFFVSKWKDIVFARNSSASRGNRIDLIEKYRHMAFVDRILVLPAGLRDIEIGNDGRVTTNEVNDLYLKAIGISNTVASSNYHDAVGLDNARRNLQYVFNQIFDHFVGVIKGKRGLFQDKWGSRRIFNGTSNVITAMNPSCAELGSKQSLTVNDHITGLYQHMKGIEPIVYNMLKNGYLSKVFGDVSGHAYLVNPETLKGEYIKVPVAVYDRWNSSEGLSKVITSYHEIEARHRPIKIGDHYLALIYKGNNHFKLFSDIEDLPSDFNKEDVYPVTLAEFLYIAGYNEWNKYPSTITRYPIATIGSIFVTSSYVKTTLVGEDRWELDDDWSVKGEQFRALEFPTPGAAFVDSLIPNTSRLGLLGGDFDGDRCSKNTLYTTEAIEEAKTSFTKKETYLNPDGGFKTSANTSTVALMLSNITGD